MKIQISAFLLLMSSIPTFAYVPPNESIEAALSGGRSVFLAVADREKIVSAPGERPLGEASFRVTYCLKGPDCKENEYFNLKYMIEKRRDWEFGISIPIGKEILFILKKPMKKEISFESNLHMGVDKAYICDTIYGSLSNGNEATCKSIYGLGKNENISLDEIKKLLKMK